MRQLTPAALAAKEIRKILKKEFPLVKFSVTSSNFSMGDSVKVKYDNGPTTEAVESRIGHFQYGSFDSMQDLYETTNRRDDIPQTKWLCVNRHVDDEIYFELLERESKYNPDLKDCISINCWIPKFGKDVQQYFYRVVSKTDLTNGLPKA